MGMDVQLKMAELQLKEAEFNLERSKLDQLHSHKICEMDLLASEQEIIRRGIEAMVLVIKNQSEYRGTELVKPTYNKLQEFINALEIPK